MGGRSGEINILWGVETVTEMEFGSGSVLIGHYWKGVSLGILSVLSLDFSLRRLSKQGHYAQSSCFT